MHKISILDMSLKITNLRLQLHLPAGANELMALTPPPTTTTSTVWHTTCYTSSYFIFNKPITLFIMTLYQLRLSCWYRWHSHGHSRGGFIISYWHLYITSKSERKWLITWRRLFQIVFLEDHLCFDVNFAQVCSWSTNPQLVGIGEGNI